MDSITAFRLLDLPTELRLEILEYAVTSEKAITARVTVPREAYLLYLPSITKVSHRLRKESLPLYFESNEFYFSVKDVLETTPVQDLRFERRLLGFGAWCEAVGLESFMRIRRFVLRAFGSLHAPSVRVELDGKGGVEMEVRCLWQGSGTRRPKAEAKRPPEKLVQVAKEAVMRNGGKGLKPEDVVELCREIQRSGAELLYSR